MSIENIVSSGLVSAGAITAVKTAHNFLAALTGHPSEDLPTLVGSWGREYLSNLEAVTNKSRLILLDLNREPRTDVPLKILKPIFEGASAEGEPTLQDRWANLLANAVDPNNPRSIQPILPYILRDLGAMEVQFIDTLYAMTLKKMTAWILHHRASQIMYTQGSFMELFYKLGFARIPIHEAGFEDQQHPAYKADMDAYFLMMDIIRRHDVIRETILPQDAQVSKDFRPGERVHHFTELGVAFVKACRPPER